VGQHGVGLLREVTVEDLSRYSSKIKSAGSRKCPYQETDIIIENIFQSWPHIMAGKELA